MMRRTKLNHRLILFACVALCVLVPSWGAAQEFNQRSGNAAQKFDEFRRE